MKQWKLWTLAAIALLASCSSNNGEEPTLNPEPVPVTLTFSPYDVTPMTRAATSIADFCTHLDIWLNDGSTTTAIHQSSSDADFGSLSVTLDKTKTYTLTAVAHRCTTDATLADGIISFPEDKVTHSMWYTQTFSPATTTTINALMTRIVAQFHFETTDPISVACTKFRFTLNSVFDRWNVSTGGVHEINRISTVNITSTHDDGTAAFNVYAITTDAQTLHTVTVEALDASDNEIKTRTFTNVPLRNGYKTSYAGHFFTDAAVTAAFTVDDWSEYDTVTF